MRQLLNSLGLWKRLGIVLTVLWLVIAPMVFLDNALDASFERVYYMDALCKEGAEYQKEIRKAREECSEATDAKISQYYGFSYLEYLGLCLAAAVAAWLFVCAVTLTIKWVWAGRTVSP